MLPNLLALSVLTCNLAKATGLPPFTPLHCSLSSCNDSSLEFPLHLPSFRFHLDKPWPFWIFLSQHVPPANYEMTAHPAFSFYNCPSWASLKNQVSGCWGSNK